MKKKDCKILFNTLIKRTWISGDKSSENLPMFDIEEVLNFLMKLSKKNRFVDLKDNKFCFIESVEMETFETENKIITGYFKSARNEFKPDLIDKKTGNERKNPKAMSEGEIEKTHFILCLHKQHDEVYLIHEYNFHGVTTQNIINYLSYFNIKYLKSQQIAQSYSVKHLVIARENFKTELDRLTRTKIAEIYFDKKLLGSKALNFSNRSVSLKKEIKLVVSAEPRESITEVAIDIYNKFNKADSDISKVRIYGTDEYDNDVVLDTSFMGHVEFLEIDINTETGDLNTAQWHTGLKRIAKKI